MNTWLCPSCFRLDGEELELHVQAHARESVHSYDEIKQAVGELRTVAAHCPECRTRIMTDLEPVPHALESLVSAFNAFFQGVRETLAQSGLLPAGPSEDPRQRALEARQNRNTGPARPSGPTAKRPRRHK